MSDAPTEEAARVEREGVAFGLGAYLIWGFLPLYFRLLHVVGPVEVVAQRVIWSVPLLLILVVARRRLPLLRAVLANVRVLGLLALTALLIGANWLIYIWAITRGHVLEASLGYFLNPLFNVVLGVTLLKERLTRMQAIAVAFAAVGVLVLAFNASAGLWISVGLALTFACYGLLRKVAPVDSLEGLTIETALLLPVALGYVLWLGSAGAFAAHSSLTPLLIVSGIATATPLLLFAAAARRLRYATMGLLQYLSPTIQFLLAITIFGEPLTSAHLVCFGLIWTGLALYAVDAGRFAGHAIGVK